MKFRITYMSLDLGRRVTFDVGSWMDKSGFMDPETFKSTMVYIHKTSRDYPCVKIDILCEGTIFFNASSKSLFI